MAVSTVGCTDLMVFQLEKVMYLFCPAHNLHVLEQEVLQNPGRLWHCSHNQCTETQRNCGIKMNGLPLEQNKVLTCTCSSALCRESDQVWNNCSFSFRASELLSVFPETAGPGEQAVVLSMKQREKIGPASLPTLQIPLQHIWKAVWPFTALL